MANEVLIPKEVAHSVPKKAPTMVINSFLFLARNFECYTNRTDNEEWISFSNMFKINVVHFSVISLCLSFELALVNRILFSSLFRESAETWLPSQGNKEG